MAWRGVDAMSRKHSRETTRDTFQIAGKVAGKKPVPHVTFRVEADTIAATANAASNMAKTRSRLFQRWAAERPELFSAGPDVRLLVEPFDPTRDNVACSIKKFSTGTATGPEVWTYELTNTF